MALIYSIEDYRKKKTLEEAKAELRKILEPMGIWESDEAALRFYMEQAERDRNG